jgi:aldose 1-epimerase
MRSHALLRRLLLVALLLVCASPPASAQGGRWSVARARAWYDSVGWVVGSNYVPSTASNELEMWQAATWDPTTIDRELGWAESLGMNSMRVFLHDLAYREDPQGFLRRVDQFLGIAERHHIRPMLVLFDAVWDPFPKAGKQREPYPHLHNSTWAQSPGRDILVDTLSHDRVLGPYVRAVVGRFAKDRRVLAWDVFNEPDNINRPAYFVYEPRNKEVYSLALLKKAFAWARAAGATQPLTAAPWKGDYANDANMLPISRWMLDNSDVITFHSYDPLPRTQELVTALERIGGGRPVIATEYMARPIGSTFKTHLPWMAEQKVGAINWGFVNGRSQTIYPWDSWTREYTAPPPVWFHDIFQTDGTPYDTAETSLIRRTTGARASMPNTRVTKDAAAATTPSSAAPGVTRAPWGNLPDGRQVELFTLTNARGVVVKVTNYGAIITEVHVPDRNGRLDDIALGYDSLAGYLRETPYFGAVVGRVANRVAKGHFTLDGQTYTLAVNNGQNSLHGGLKGFDKVLWTPTPFQGADGVGVALRYVSPDGEEGYPGTLTVDVRYTLTPRNEIVVDYRATTDKATPINLSQHSYWNLAGTGPSNPPNAPLPVNSDHVLTIDASSYTPVDSTLIPTGEIASVAGTPFDFRTPTAVGARINAQNQQLKFGGGYDHNWVLDRNGRTGLVHAARVYEPTTGRTLDVSTTEPGIQFYTGNFLDGKIVGKNGRAYPYRSTVVLETQHFPDSPNHPNFPSVILRPGQTYQSQTVFTFGVAR